MISGQSDSSTRAPGKPAGDRVHHLAHTLVVQVDALSTRRAHANPVRPLEAALRLGRSGAKGSVALVESFEDRRGDLVREALWCLQTLPSDSQLTFTPDVRVLS